MKNPKQFEIPENLMVFAPLPGETQMCTDIDPEIPGLNRSCLKACSAMEFQLGEVRSFSTTHVEASLVVLNQICWIINMYLASCASFLVCFTLYSDYR